MILSGKAYWAAILTPKDNYTKDGKEYALDVVLDEASEKKFIKEFGKDKIRPVKNDQGKEHISGKPYVKFSRPTTKKDGDPIKALEVVDRRGKDWDQTELVGNGSEISLIVSTYEWEYRGKTGKKPNLNKIRIDNHVPYEGGEDFEYNGGDEFEDSADTGSSEAWDEDDAE